MGFVSSGISDVRAFGVVAGVSSEGAAVSQSLSLIVSWRSEHFDKLHQVYVNGQLAGVAGNGSQRRMRVEVGGCVYGGSRVEVVAVELGEGGINFGDELEPGASLGRVRFCMKRDMGLGLEGSAEFRVTDVESGEIVESTVPLWGSWKDKGGFGMSCFGRSDFGYDGSAGVGFGRGVFGGSEFGFDFGDLVYESGELESGRYGLGVSIKDRFGVGEEIDCGEVVMVRGAMCAHDLDVEKQGEKIILKIVD
jgi:hypothetical protein